MAADLRLRPATVEDIADLATIQLTARASSPMPPGRHPEPEVHAWLESRLGSGEQLWVGEVDGVPAGYSRSTGTWLDDLYVAPGHAGQGVGSALLALVQAQLPGGFCLWVFEANTPARDFYLARGFVALERTDGRDNEEGEPDLRMAWPGNDPIAFFRRLIDEVDDQLGDLLSRRAALTAAVQRARPGGGRDPGREAQVAALLAARAPALGVERVARIVDTIITQSLDAAADGG